MPKLSIREDVILRKSLFAQCFIVSVTVLTLAACAHERGRFGLLNGPGTDLDATNIQEYTTAQNQVLENLVILAGINTTGALPAYGSSDWTPVVQAGINYVDQQCRKYIDALFWWDRGRTTTRNEVNLVGTATAGTLGIIGAAAQPIALTAVAFGVTSASIDNLANSILYQVEPSGVRGIVDRTQAVYKEAIKDTQYKTRPGAVSAIGGYLALCLPETLEAEVNHAIAGAKVEGPPGSTNQAPTVTISTNSNASNSPIRFPEPNERNEASNFIQNLIREAREKNGTNRGQLILTSIAECEKQYSNLPPQLAELYTDPQYAELSKQVMTCLQRNGIFPNP